LKEIEKERERDVEREAIERDTIKRETIERDRKRERER
jgi:hypothetical protein